MKAHQNDGHLTTEYRIALQGSKRNKDCYRTPTDISMQFIQ